MKDTRAALLAEAEILIRSRGYSGFSYADLSAVVGIRKASIHHHFPTKIDLVTSLLAAYGLRYAAGLDAILASSTDGIVRIDAYARFYLQGVERGLGCLCAALAAELETLPTSLRADLAAFFEAHVGWIEQVLRAGQANGTITSTIDPVPCARMVIATLEGALMMERVAAGPSGFKGIVDALRTALAP